MIKLEFWIPILILLLIFFLIQQQITMKKTKYAVAVFDSKIKGTVLFTQDSSFKDIKIDIQLSGLGKNRKRGFHIHQFGDLSDHCTSMCAHFNPDKQNHGGLDSKIRHAGDLGNVISDENGECKMTIYAKGIQLTGEKYNIIGRGLIIHEDEDDLGLGGKEDSLTTGHAGKRSACAVIGISKLNQPC